MIEKHEIDVITRSVGRVVKEYVSVAISGLVTREQLDQHLKETTAAVDDLLRRAVDGIPVPKDGKDADMEAVLAAVNVEVAKTVAAIPPAKDGRDGMDGKDIDPEFVRAEISKAVAALPVPKDGKDGLNGKDADIDFLLSAITEETAKAVAAIPIPKDGKDGRDASLGETIEALKAMLKDNTDGLTSKMIQMFQAQIPIPKDGKDGESIPPDPAMVRAEAQKAIDEIFTTVIRGFHEA